ncbi:sarcosine oxidase subunit delta [Candidatus Thioglobus sp.]|nr:sarcosine oxidase subunit delta [Candidatus Thioglobus sp.]
MFSIQCPYCKEPRDQNEFSPAGEAFIARPENPEALSDEQWADYVFYRTNLKGDHWEQWVHTSGCRKYFLVKRSTISHEVIEVATFEEMDSENAS